MTPPPTPLTAEALLAHQSWLRTLARRLVSDPHRADDLAQATWVAALERWPEGDLRHWLGSVLRKLRAQGGRAQARRAEHEPEAARDEAQPAAFDAIERVASQRALAQAVLELDEPYRSTLLLRYYEERSPRDIARSTGVPVATVKTRLRCGLERLRTELDSGHGGSGRNWVLALAPLLEEPGRITTPLIGTLAVSTLVKTLAGAVTLTAAAATLFVLRPSVSDAAAGSALSEPETTAPELLAAGPGSAPEAEAPVSQRSVAPAPAAAAGLAPATSDPTPAAGTSAAALVRGRVLDAEGAPLGGIAVVYAGGADRSEASEDATSPRARSHFDGRFEIPAPSGQGLLEAEDRSLATVLGGSVASRAQDVETVLVVAPAADLGGVVVDDWGRPVVDARVTLELPADFRSRFDSVLDYSAKFEHAAVTDAEGSFSLTHAPLVSTASLRVVATGYPALLDPQPTASHVRLRYVLRRPRIREGVLEGVVLDAEGNPVAGARVAMGLATTSSDAEGTFRFDLSDGSSWNVRVEIRVAMRCHFRLELDPESGVDAFEVHDAAGEQLAINLFEGGGRMTLHHMPVAEVGTAVLGVSDEARTMVLFAGGEEADRLPLDLHPGETVVVRY